MSLLVLETLLLPVITLGTVFQIQSGLSFSASEIAGPIVGFAILAAGAVAVIIAILGNIPDRVAAEVDDAW